jgi:hypothetical protein
MAIMDHGRSELSDRLKNSGRVSRAMDKCELLLKDCPDELVSLLTAIGSEFWIVA